MFMADIDGQHGCEPIVRCPNCGGDRYVSNHIDERPFAALAAQAPFLRHYGESDLAVDALTLWYAVRIANFVRPRWACLTCSGVRFDD